MLIPLRRSTLVTYFLLADLMVSRPARTKPMKYFHRPSHLSLPTPRRTHLQPVARSPFPILLRLRPHQEILNLVVTPRLPKHA
ncbi:hypothetical protein BDY19DRAFT_935415 [Irpex rosettiformis]|uniref:Uncharacterized protein n=1 Tax=Irpex rosettiformis TaxID=378272 RepID=A0ACB8U857_9APHY|nr:hypothetical protein BDY19DRAFT_935415 [Irpex rosettiformis]